MQPGGDTGSTGGSVVTARVTTWSHQPLRFKSLMCIEWSMEMQENMNMEVMVMITVWAVNWETRLAPLTMMVITVQARVMMKW